VQIVGLAGSGAPTNFYADETGAGQVQNLGTGNQLLFRGSVESFTMVNTGVTAPSSVFFR
jgi:hypothetical protein